MAPGVLLELYMSQGVRDTYCIERVKDEDDPLHQYIPNPYPICPIGLPRHLFMYLVTSFIQSGVVNYCIFNALRIEITGH